MRTRRVSSTIPLREFPPEVNLPTNEPHARAPRHQHRRVLEAHAVRPGRPIPLGRTWRGDGPGGTSNERGDSPAGGSQPDRYVRREAGPPCPVASRWDARAWPPTRRAKPGKDVADVA